MQNKSKSLKVVLAGLVFGISANFFANSFYKIFGETLYNYWLTGIVALIFMILSILIIEKNSH